MVAPYLQKWRDDPLDPPLETDSDITIHCTASISAAPTQPINLHAFTIWRIPTAGIGPARAKAQRILSPQTDPYRMGGGRARRRTGARAFGEVKWKVGRTVEHLGGGFAVPLRADLRPEQPGNQ